MVATQVPVAEWHARFPDPTIGDAILDRLVHNAYRLDLLGESRRKVNSPLPMPSTRGYNLHASVASLRQVDGMPGTPGRFRRNTHIIEPDILACRRISWFSILLGELGIGLLV